MTGRLAQFAPGPTAQVPEDRPHVQHGDRPPRRLKVVVHDVEVRPREVELPDKCPNCGAPLASEEENLFFGCSELRDESGWPDRSTRFLELHHSVECLECCHRLEAATFTLPPEEPKT